MRPDLAGPACGGKTTPFVPAKVTEGMRIAYLRCMDGHLFRTSSSCPFDGWTDDGFSEVFDVIQRLERSGVTPSLDALESEGVPASFLHNVWVIEFPEQTEPFIALAPEWVITGAGEMRLHNERGVVFGRDIDSEGNPTRGRGPDEG